MHAEAEPEEESTGEKRSSRAMWSGVISFGLVTIPVRLYPAVREKTVRFHLLDAKEKVRLHRKMVRSTDEKEIPAQQQVRGYEVAPDQYVVVTDEELRSVEPHGGRAVEIEEFVTLEEIDPVYFQRAYYLVPGENGAKPYQLLLDAMTRAKRVAVGRFFMRDKEYLVALRPIDGVVCLETMHFADEVVSTDTLDLPRNVKLDERETKIALQLVEAMSGSFQPQRYRDSYRDAVERMVQAKVAGKEIVTQPPAEEEPGEVVDLIARLEASLAEKRKRKKAG
jgi:DNA end-binding protein Ku